MEVDFEILIIFFIALIFTIVTILSRGNREETVFSLITAVAWIVLGFGFVGASPTFPVYAILFTGIGIIFVVNTIQMTMDMLRQKRNWR